MNDIEQEIRRAKPEYERMPSAFKARLRNQLQAQARPSRLRHIGWIGSVAGVAAIFVVGVFAWLVYARPLAIVDDATTDAAEADALVEAVHTDEMIAVFGEQIELHAIELPANVDDSQDRLPVFLTWRLHEVPSDLAVQIELWGMDTFLRNRLLTSSESNLATGSSSEELVKLTYWLDVGEGISADNLYLIIRLNDSASGEPLAVQGRSTQQIAINTVADSVTLWEVPLDLSGTVSEIPDSPAGAKIVQDIALEFTSSEFKPVAAGTLRELYGVSTTKLTYDAVIDLLGATAVSTNHGSNIIDITPIERAEEVWFVQVVGIFSAEAFKLQYYTLAITKNSKIVAAGSAEKPIIDAVRDVHGQTFANAEILAYPSRTLLTTASELGFFSLDAIPAGPVDILINDAIVTIPEGAGTLDLGKLIYHQDATANQLTLINNMRRDGVYYFESADNWFSSDQNNFYFFPAQSPTDPNCRILWEAPHFIDSCNQHRWDSTGQSLDSPYHPDLPSYWTRQRERMLWIEKADILSNQSTLSYDATVQHGITLTIRAFTQRPEPIDSVDASESTIRTGVILDPVWGANAPNLTVQATEPMLWDERERDMTLIDFGDKNVRSYENGQQLHDQLFVQRDGSGQATTMTLQLSLQLERVQQQSQIALDFAGRQAGDVWETDIALPLGLASVRVSKVEWMDTANDGSKRVRLYLDDNSPAGITLDCAGVVITEPTEVACKRLGEWTLAQRVQDGQPLDITIHGNVRFDRPWQVTWQVP